MFFSPCDFEVLYGIEYARLEGYLFTSIEVYTNLDATEIELTTLYIYLFIRCIPINLL